MNEQRDDKLMTAASQLATEIEPQRDLWPGIERAITETAPRRSRWTPGSVSRSEVINIKMTLDFLSETPDIPLLVFP